MGSSHPGSGSIALRRTASSSVSCGTCLPACIASLSWRSVIIVQTPVEQIGGVIVVMPASDETAVDHRRRGSVREDDTEALAGGCRPERLGFIELLKTRLQGDGRSVR